MAFFGSTVPMEYFMYGAIGFLLAWLMALMCFPAVHNRAQRLLRKQYDLAPLSVQEMRAEKDQIRASFAAATRDLEISIEKLREKTAAHATDAARKSQLIDRLKNELEAQNELLAQSTEREREARTQLLEVRREFDTVYAELANITQSERGVRGELRETKLELAVRDTTLEAAHATDLANKSQLIERLKTELGALNDMLAERTEHERVTRMELREMRRELAMKDSALDSAEQEVSAIKTEITRLAPLLQMPATKMPEIEKPVGTTAAQMLVAQMPMNQIPLAPLPASPVPPRHAETVPLAPVTPQHPSVLPPLHDDSIMRAWTEIDAAARRVEQRHSDAPAQAPGNNQALRAAFAPMMKPAN